MTEEQEIYIVVIAIRILNDLSYETGLNDRQCVFSHQNIHETTNDYDHEWDFRSCGENREPPTHHRTRTRSRTRKRTHTRTHTHTHTYTHTRNSIKSAIKKGGSRDLREQFSPRKCKSASDK